MMEEEEFRDIAAIFALAGMLAHSRGEFEGHFEGNFGLGGQGGQEGSLGGTQVGDMYGRMFGYRSRDQNMDWHIAIAEEAYELADCMLSARRLEEDA